jgi:uncharacterized Zn-finger protein
MQKLPQEIITVQSTKLHCDGGGPLGHPRVFLNMGAAHDIDCPYCGRKFVLAAGAACGHNHH